MKLALLTIGQSPRKDVYEDIGYLLKDIDFIERGALDGLSKDFIRRRLTPKPGEDFYVTRLRDGTEVKVSKKLIEERIRNLIMEIEDKVDLIVVLCTGDFEIKSKKPVLLPSKVIMEIVRALSPRKLGILVPLHDQIRMAYRRWCKLIKNIVIQAWSPYSGNVNSLKEIAKKIKDVDVMVMDCIGYSTVHGRIVKDIIKKPTLIPRVIALSIATSMV